MHEPSALVVISSTAASATSNGASLRVGDVAEVLRHAGYRVVTVPPDRLAAADGHFCLGVAVSYVNTPALRALRARTGAVWLDAVDSWLAVNLSGLAAGRLSYAARLARDSLWLAVAATPDLVTYISGADRRQDRATWRNARRLVLPGRAQVPAVQPRGSRRRAVLVGDWQYGPNRDGLAWFAQRCLPTLERYLLGVQWIGHVYGPGAPPLPERLVGHGWVDDGSLLYRAGDVHVAPLTHGGGVKRKVLQPLLAGLPVVTTPSGAHGLQRHPSMDVARRPEAFALALGRRLEDPPAEAPAAVPRDLLVDADDTAALMGWLRSAAAVCADQRRTP